MRKFLARAIHCFRPPRGSFSYRYQLIAGLPDTGPISAIPVLVAFNHRARNHAGFEGGPDIHSLRGADEETRAKARSKTAEDGDSL